MTIDGHNWFAKDGLYTTSVKYGNKLNGPNCETQYVGDGSERVTSWFARSSASPYFGWTLRPNLRLNKSFLSPDGQAKECIFKALWQTATNKYHIRLWYERLVAGERYRFTIPNNAGFDSRIEGKEFELREESSCEFWTSEGNVKQLVPTGLEALMPDNNDNTLAEPVSLYQKSGDGEIKFYSEQTDGAYLTNNYFFSRKSYTLNFDLQYNSLSLLTRSLKFETELDTVLNTHELEAPSRDGYEFLGWFANPAFTEPFNFEEETMPAKNLTLYAKWKENVPECKVNFYNYYDGTLYDSQSVAIG